ncbi:MAG: hypothetical protein ACHQUB_01765 [Candidatus Saccharimonadia bacterium]
MSDDQPDLALIEEIEATNQFKEKHGRYVHFVLEHGVDLYPSEPEPDYDEYVYRYLSDPPSHLATATEEVRIEAAIEAWTLAVYSREYRIGNAVVVRIRLAAFATHRCMLDHACETLSNDSHLLSTMRAQTRMRVIEELWVEHQWREPLIALVEAEFPGPELTLANIEAFESRRPSFLAEAHERLKMLHDLTEILEGMLWVQGQIVAEKEQQLLMVLAGQAALLSARGGGHDHLAIALHMQARELIGANAEQPEHPVWAEILTKFFPIPAMG